MSLSFQLAFEHKAGRFAKLADDLKRAYAQAVYAEAQRIMLASKLICPVDTGTLKASGTVYEPETTSAGVEVKLGYGGAAADYAEIVHENLNAYHAPPTQAKYLEQPLNEAKKGFEDRIATRVRETMGWQS